MVTATPRPPYPQERTSTHCIGDWVRPGAGLDMCGQFRPHRDSIPGPSISYRVIIPTTLVMGGKEKVPTAGISTVHGTSFRGLSIGVPINQTSPSNKALTILSEHKVTTRQAELRNDRFHICTVHCILVFVQPPTYLLPSTEIPTCLTYLFYRTTHLPST